MVIPKQCYNCVTRLLIFYYIFPSASRSRGGLRRGGCMSVARWQEPSVPGSEPPAGVPGPVARHQRPGSSPFGGGTGDARYRPCFLILIEKLPDRLPRRARHGPVEKDELGPDELYGVVPNPCLRVMIRSSLSASSSVTAYREMTSLPITTIFLLFSCFRRARSSRYML